MTDSMARPASHSSPPAERSGKGKALLGLCRVSNLPTVWMNVLAAALLAGDSCTADSCDEILGCAHTPIDPCPPPLDPPPLVPAASNWGRVLLVLFVVAAGGSLLGVRRRFGRWGQ